MPQLAPAASGPVLTISARQVCAEDPWVTSDQLADWQEGSQKQKYPDPAKAKPMGTSDSDVRLTMHQRCPWIQDPVDQEQGHSVEDSQCAAPLEPVSQYSSRSTDVWSNLRSCSVTPCISPFSVRVIGHHVAHQPQPPAMGCSACTPSWGTMCAQSSTAAAANQLWCSDCGMLQAAGCKAVACQHCSVITGLRSLKLAGSRTSGYSQMTGMGCCQVGSGLTHTAAACSAALEAMVLPHPGRIWPRRSGFTCPQPCKAHVLPAFSPAPGRHLSVHI